MAMLLVVGSESRIGSCMSKYIKVNEKVAEKSKENWECTVYYKWVGYQVMSPPRIQEDKMLNSRRKTPESRQIGPLQ